MQCCLLPAPLAHALAPLERLASCWLTPFHRHKLTRLYEMREAEAGWLFKLSSPGDPSTSTAPRRELADGGVVPDVSVAEGSNGADISAAARVAASGSTSSLLPPPARASTQQRSAAAPHIPSAGGSGLSCAGPGTRTYTPCEYAFELL